MIQSNLNFSIALYSLSLEINKVSDFRKQAIVLRQIFLKNKQFIILLDCQFIDLKKRLEIVDLVFKNDFSIQLINFIKVLTCDHKILKIIQIIDDFIYLCNKKLDIKDGVIYTTLPLNEKYISDIESILSQKTNKSVYLKNKIDSSLIGGIKLVVDDHVIDGSLKYQVKQLHDYLLKKASLK